MDDSEHINGEAQDDAVTPRTTNKRRTALVLIGCSILQLPIWGIPMTFGIFQDAYSHSHVLHGNDGTIGLVGTTMNGVMYLSMPVLFTLMDRGPWAHWRRRLAILGVGLSSVAFCVCSFATQVWDLIVLQGIIAAFGSALLYSSTTLYLDEWFSSGRATAYGAILSAKNLTGTCCPLLTSAFLGRLGIAWTWRIWALITLATGLVGVLIIPHSVIERPRRSARTIPWNFLRHPTFYVYSLANLVFSSGYALPQNYLPTFASDILHLSGITSALIITVFNAPGIISCVGFGLMSDRLGLSSTANTCISAFGASLSAFLLWGLPSDIPAVLFVFAACYGFFAGGYSATWGGWIKDLEQEAAQNNEAIHTGMLYGLLNGARGIGYVLGGVAGVELLHVGAVEGTGRWGYSTKYGAMIVFTGISAALGGWNIVWSSCRKVKRDWQSSPIQLRHVLTRRLLWSINHTAREA